MPSLLRSNTYELETAILERAGVVQKKERIEDQFLAEMENSGLTPSTILSRIACIMEGGESDGVKLQAAREAMKIYMHPAFVERRAEQNAAQAAIVFNIQSQNVNLQSVLTPVIQPDE